METVLCCRLRCIDCHICGFQSQLGQTGITKCIFSNRTDCFRNRNFRQISTVFECLAANCCQCFRQSYLLQQGTTSKRIIVKSSHARPGQIDLCKCTAVEKCMVRNICQCAGERGTFQRCAGIEGMVLNGGHLRIGEVNLIKRTTTGES